MKNNLKEKFEIQLKNFYSNTNPNLIKILSTSIFNDSPPMEQFLAELFGKHTEFENTLKSILIKIIKEELNLPINETRIKNIEILLDTTGRIIKISDKIKTGKIKSLESKLLTMQKKEHLKEIEITVKLFEKFTKSSFSLLKYYKEIPVKCTGILKKSVSEHLIFEVPNCKYFIFKENEELAIINKKFPQPVKGRIEHFNIKKEIVSIQTLGFTEIFQDKRQYLRVEPSKKIEVVIKTANGFIKGKLKDISIGGIGIITENPKKLRIGETVVINFFLQEKEFKIGFFVRHLRKLNSHTKIGLEFINEALYEEEIAQYTIKRETEILNEIRL